MKALDIIVAKRDGRAHSEAELRWLVEGITDGSIADYQLAAWLMAVLWRGMTERETASLTEAMARSGETVDLSRLREPAVDKHSTGGVGDKTSLVALPLAAATGLTVAKMSGRGLGHTGGTLDKLESVPGLSVEMDARRFMEQAEQIGLVIAGQSTELAPADKRMYALRNLCGTVPSHALIAASIMSKKLAAGAEGIVLDVKVGRGAFLPDPDEARALAGTMLAIGRRAGRRMAACLSGMDQPLGQAVGNALELAEACRTLRGEGPNDLHALSMTVAGLMHVVAGRAGRPGEVEAELMAAIQSGRALELLGDMVAAQGGDRSCIEDPLRLPQAPIQRVLEVETGGWVAAIDALAIGETACELGAGRRAKGDAVDPAVGIRLLAKVGDRVDRGAVLAEIHARTEAAADLAEARVRAAYAIAPAPLSERPEPIVIEILA